jgi:hypothetical protein
MIQPEAALFALTQFGMSPFSFLFNTKTLRRQTLTPGLTSDHRIGYKTSEQANKYGVAGLKSDDLQLQPTDLPLPQISQSFLFIFTSLLYLLAWTLISLSHMSFLAFCYTAFAMKLTIVLVIMSSFESQH